ncbi:MAG: 50S ribosomal protein L18 [Candidatus Staskawiczbacteria bacterium RIFCSPLOWO2_01_FULL_33_9]|uniref:Large ribosomal subunit protein uL18 n=1 Tax=Candidatus Staskawiczbacteria bacterium RIFCSPLOWO2_01_FULL_33_9 TaxID=1802211 RepID=A0A1G2I6F2_9BACT|nr:MAG: 50S ribosomal protein L18 [Candidatus Staskawiczbacteria bacterium RIFCSPLOWO2_01_FULL_33_9]
MLTKQLKRLRRHKKIRTRIHGTKARPRLCVFRSLSHIYAQLIDDDTAKVLASASDKEIKEKKTDEKMNHKVLSAFLVGKLIAKKAEAQNIKRVIFDRGGIVFHGRVKALADGAREEGLKF